MFFHSYQLPSKWTWSVLSDMRSQQSDSVSSRNLILKMPLDLSAFADVIRHPIYIDRDVLEKHASIFASYAGKKALVVTGSTSSQANHSLSKLKDILASHEIESYLFNEVEPNPSTVTVTKAARQVSGKQVDFIIGLGGGSAMDAAKAIAVYLVNKEGIKVAISESPKDVICISTAAGTASEVTPYAILTDHIKQTKISIPNLVFPKISLVDPCYQLYLPTSQTLSMFLDILCHAVESMLTVKTTELSVKASVESLKHLQICWHFYLKPAIMKTTFTDLTDPEMTEFRDEMTLASCYAGIAITIGGTSIAHGLSYKITYFKGVPHGKACAIFLIAYLNICKQHSETHDDQRFEQTLEKILSAFQMDSYEEFKDMVEQVICADVEGRRTLYDEEEVMDYAISLFASGKNKMHPWPITVPEVVGIIRQSCYDTLPLADGEGGESQ